MSSPRWMTMSNLPDAFAPSDQQSNNQTNNGPLQRLIEQHAPILIQPTIDVKNGNGLLAAFYHVIRNCNHSQCDDIRCVKSFILSVVYESEATYSAHDDKSLNPSINHFGTFCYRSHNYRAYHRTADINHLALHGFEFNQPIAQPIDQTINQTINSSPNGVKVHTSDVSDLINQSTYDSIHSTDFGGLQTWCRGDKFTLMCYSFMSHKDTTIKRSACRSVKWPISDIDMRARLDEWAELDEQMRQQHLSEAQRLDRMIQSNQSINQSTNQSINQSTNQSNNRVVLYVTTSNHLMSPFDTNIRRSSSHQTIHSNYPLFVGDRRVAERFCQSVIADKWTIWSLLPRFIDPRPRDLRKARKTWKHLHQHDETDNINQSSNQSINQSNQSNDQSHSIIQVDNADHSCIVTTSGGVIANMQPYSE